MKKMNYHKPVLLNESINGLITDKSGVYVDATFGGGGHSKGILDKLSDNAKLFSFDQDLDAIKNDFKDPRLVLIHSNFKEIKKYLKFYGIFSVDGILADFGVSSHQFDTKERGFSYRKDGPLDMRMNQNLTITASEVLNNYSELSLKKIFTSFGEISKPSKLIEIIIKNRANKPLNTTKDLFEIINQVIPERYLNSYSSKIFQAIRIEVNQELDSIKKLLLHSKDILRSKGRIVCLTYHSLEDRIVKKFFSEGVFTGYAKKDFYGNKKLFFKKIGKFQTPSTKELRNNKRSRSAKLRIAEKI